MVVTEQRLGPAAEPTLADLGDALTAVYGTDFGVHDPSWISRFTDATRQAAAYRTRTRAARRGRRAHPPAGGRTGDRPRRAGRGQPRVEARPGRPGHLTRRPAGHLPRGTAPRHGPGAEELDGAGPPAAQRPAHRRAPRHVADLLAFDEPRAQLAGLLSGLDVRYDLGRVTRCSAAGCPTSTSSRPTARGSSSCSTTPGRCCSPRRAGHHQRLHPAVAVVAEGAEPADPGRHSARPDPADLHPQPAGHRHRPAQPPGTGSAVRGRCGARRRDRRARRQPARAACCSP